MTNRAYAKNNGDGLLCSILWYWHSVVLALLHQIRTNRKENGAVVAKYKRVFFLFGKTH
jgi:hypothetical protein